MKKKVAIRCLIGAPIGLALSTIITIGIIIFCIIILGVIIFSISSAVFAIIKTELSSNGVFLFTTL